MIIHHQISKLVFELTFPSEDKVVSGQQKIEQLVHDHLTDALETILDKYDQQEVTTKIDRLEIDLDFIDPSLSESEIIRQFTHKIEAQLDKLFENNEDQSYTKHIDGHDITIERQTEGQAQTDIELTLFIIRNGHLPWWVNEKSELISLNELVTNLIKVDESRFLKSLGNELQFINFRKRLVQLFSQEQLKWLVASVNKDIEFHPNSFEAIRLLQPEKRHEVYDRLIIAGLVYEQTDIKTYLNMLYEAAVIVDFSVDNLINAGKNRINQSDLIHQLSREKSKQSKNSLVDHTIEEKELHKKNRLTTKNSEEENTKEAQQNLTIKAAKEEQKTNSENDLTSETVQEKKEQENRTENDLTYKDKTPKETNSKKDITTETIEGKNEKEALAETDLTTTTFRKDLEESHYQNLINLNQINEDIIDGIVIRRAGLVLTVPFLSSFFSELGLLKEKKYTSEKARHHAVYLLYYIATGSEVIPDEHHLVFEKICCGVDITECLFPFQGFSSQEKEEVNSLLLSILEAWKALKNSSPQAVREAFLSREGYLKKQGDGTWHVHIERQTIDILIDRIPWTISIMRIPSVNEMLYVEW